MGLIPRQVLHGCSCIEFFDILLLEIQLMHFKCQLEGQASILY